MAVNKVVYGGETVIDLTNDSVTPDKMLLGVTAHNKSGARITGTLTPQEKTVDITENGTKMVIADEGYLLSKVIINTDIKQKYCLVRWYNDDRTTLLYETFVPYGGNAMYAGDAPISVNEGLFILSGFEPSTANVTEDINCYAVYEAAQGLDDVSWAQISAYSEAEIAENYFAIGDTKAVTLNGTIGTLTVNATYYAYIIGFNHDSALEGNGITFGTFKDANGVDICLTDSKYNTNSTDGTKCFNINHSISKNYGGWAGSDLRYDILGSTDRAPVPAPSITTTYNKRGLNPTPTCATNPVANTLMAALPFELRAVMKPITKYSNNTGDRAESPNCIDVGVDYLPLLAEFEINGAKVLANKHESTYQVQYEYFSAGGNALKYSHSDPTNTMTAYWTRSPSVSDSGFVRVNQNANTGAAGFYFGSVSTSIGLAPIFKV